VRLSRILVLVALLAAGWAAFGDRVAGEENDGRVLRVIDGDTLVVRVDGEPRRVRLIGIDTPERGDCGFRRATTELRRRVGGRRVVLEADPTQDREDRYGRLLAYVRRPGAERTAQEALLRSGWAEVYVYGGRPFRRVAAFRAAARSARRAGRGVLRACRRLAA
jgi:micrococcal nuclease